MIGIENEPWLHLRHKIERIEKLLGVTAWRAKRAGQAEERARERGYQLLKEYPQYSRGSAVIWATALFVLAGLAAIYWLDYFLLSPVTKLVVFQWFESSALGLTIARFAVPASIIALEGFVGYLRESATVQSREVLGSRFAPFAWTVVGVALALAVPAGVVATFVASEFGFSTTISVFVLGMLLLFAFVAHVAILFGSERVHQVVTFMRVRADFQGAERALRREEATGQRCAQDGVEGYRYLLRLVGVYNMLVLRNEEQLVRPIDPGPFDKVTQSFLTDTIGPIDFGEVPRLRLPSGSDDDSGNRPIAA